MPIDIQYLLFLQDLRNATGGVFNEFFNSMSKVAVDLLLLLPFVIFWGVSKKWGYRFILTMYITDLVNGVIKLTVCAYRPWIRSDLIEPAGDSKVAATGYSFPSGHTICATTGYGTVIAWQHKKRRWLAVLCGIAIALTGFSRNFLGVHTPQDVIVGFLESLVIILIIGKVQSKISGNEKLIDILTLVGIVLTIAARIYIVFKPYPMEYVDGVLLVDPQIMMKDSFVACGVMIGILCGSYVERHFTHYEIPVGSANLPILTVIGGAILFAWRTWFAPATIVAALGIHWGNFIAYFLMGFFALVIWPQVIKKLA